MKCSIATKIQVAFVPQVPTAWAAAVALVANRQNALYVLICEKETGVVVCTPRSTAKAAVQEGILCLRLVI